jgi:hypothetical protein
MTDPNLPVGWRVIDTETRKEIGQYALSRDAMQACEELEPEPGITGPRYIIEGIRASDLKIATPR